MGPKSLRDLISKRKKCVTPRFVLWPRHTHEEYLALDKMEKIVVVGNEEARESLFSVSGDQRDKNQNYLGPIVHVG